MKRFLFFILAAVSLTGLTACRRSANCFPIDQCYDVVQETYIHKYGIEVPPDEWRSKGQDGTIMTTLNNGITVTRNFNNGVQDGETFYTFPHSDRIEAIEIYAKGKLIRENTNYISGTPKQEISYETKGIKKITHWYENGNKKSIEEYDLDGLLVSAQYYDSRNQWDSQVDNMEGIRTYRDKWGQLEYKDTIQGGVMTARTSYHPNGTPKDLTPYQNGIVHGIRKSFLPSGEPSSIEEWVDGKQNGLTITFINGEKYAEIPYSNGYKDGIERRYKDGTVVVEEISWHKDQKHGSHAIRVANSEQVAWFYEGKPVTKGNYEMLSHPR